MHTKQATYVYVRTCTYTHRSTHTHIQTYVLSRSCDFLIFRVVPELGKYGPQPGVILRSRMFMWAYYIRYIKLKQFYWFVRKQLRVPEKTSRHSNCGTWWRIGRVGAFRSEGGGFDSRSSRHVGTLGKFLTRSCLWRFGVKLRHSTRAVSGALLSSSGLEGAL